MIDADETLALLAALDEGAPAEKLEALMRGTELDRVFPSAGISRAFGLDCLLAVNDDARRLKLDESGKSVVGYLENLVQVRPRFEALLREFRESEADLTASAFETTRRLLPESCSLGRIRLVFLPLGLDFRTERETVYMDPLASVQYGLEGIRRTLSHEFHHVARYRLTGVNLTLMEPSETRRPESLADTFRVWVAWLEMEGIADCVSNATQVEIPSLREGIEERRRQMDQYATLLGGALDSFRAANRGQASNSTALGDLQRSLGGLAHPVGARMAGYILTELGRPSLVECVGHPDRFLQRYNDVAIKKRLVGFDELFVDWLDPV